MDEPKKIVPKFHLSKKDWSPITLGEVVYRLEDGSSYCFPIADGDDPDEIAALAKLYGKRMGLEGVDTRIVKVIFENEEKQDAILPILVLTPRGNPHALAFKTEVDSGVLTNSRTRFWYPVKLGEMLFRAQVGDTVALMVDPDMSSLSTSNLVMATAKSYSARLSLNTPCKLGKAIDRDDAGAEIVRRVVLMFPSNNEPASQFFKEHGRVDPTGEMPPAILETLMRPPLPPEGDTTPKKRGRPPKAKPLPE